MKSQNPILAYFSSAFEEFSKVTWPTKEQAALLTGIVVGVSLVLAVLIGAFDFGLNEGYKALLKKIPEWTQSTPEDAGVPVDVSDFDVTIPDSGITPESETSSPQ